MEPEIKSAADPARLSDRILSALQLALDQEDVLIAENLLRVLELAVTRKSGGADFVERRDYSPSITDAIRRLNAMKKDRPAQL
jgi:hypothetical protein